MPVLELTIFISILLAVLFIVCFGVDAWKNRGHGIEQSSLLPLADDDGDISKMNKTSEKINIKAPDTTNNE